MASRWGLGRLASVFSITFRQARLIPKRYAPGLDVNNVTPRIVRFEGDFASSWGGTRRTLALPHCFQHHHELSSSAGGVQGRGDAAFSETPSVSEIAQEAIAEAEIVEEPLPERTKLLVLGGNGFVGSAVCQEAVKRGVEVISLNRSGAPNRNEPWVHDVEWVRGSLFEVDNWRHLLKDATAVVSCVGGFGTAEQMKRINGDANVAAVQAAADQGVPRFVYISAHDFGLPSFVLQGYYEGKRLAEKAVFDYFPYGGVVLRPGMIHGTRQVGNISLPLSAIGTPLEMILKNAKWASSLPLVGPALVPPVKVSAVARTAVRGAVDHAIPPGAVDVWGILRFGDH